MGHFEVGSGVRDRVSLDGAWDLRVGGSSYRINVPGSWQSQVPELRHYSGKATCSRVFRVPEDWNGREIALHFGAVDWLAEVSVNGRAVGSHEGGYTPFEFPIHDAVRFGEENEVTVTITDPGPDKPVDGFDYGEIPHGKQSWYGLVSGIWQSVYLESRDFFSIRRIRVTPDIDAATAEIAVVFSAPAAEDCDISVEVVAPDGAIAASAEGKPRAGEPEWKATIPIPNAKLWTTDEPNLYRVKAAITRNGRRLDEQSATFGMRKIEAKDGKLLLNGKPVFLISALDQDFYPITHYTPPSEEYIRDQFIKAKELGLNSLRCHIKVPDPRYLDWADRLGLLIWYEIPNWDVLNENSKRRARQMLDEMVARDWNHPSLVIISIINEEWGIKPREEAEHRSWLVEMYDYAKSLGSGRLIVDNSPCGDSFHVKTDIDDFHMYYSIPDHCREFARWIADFAGRPAWTFSPHGDAARRGDEPLMLSEFGNWGLPSMRRIRDCYGGKEPWWIKTSEGATRPEGADARFEAWGLDRVFGDWDGMATALQEQEWRALKFQIEEMRKYPSIAGYVITEFTDLQWECNGLLDYCRNPKSFHDRMRAVQAQDVIVPEWERTSYWAGERIELPITVSHFSQSPVRGCKLRWRIPEFGLSGAIKNVTVDIASAERIGSITAQSSPTAESVMAHVELELIDGDGGVMASNTQEFPIISIKDGKIPVAAPIYAPALCGPIMRRGGEVAHERAGAGLLVLEQMDDASLEAIRGGASAIVAVDEPEGWMPAGIEIRSRHEQGWGGDWCNSVIWFRPGLFDGLPAIEILDFAFSEILPSHVITGFDPVKDRDDILSGIFVGWLAHPAAIVVGFKLGKGKVLLTTLPLIEAYDRDPFATAALNRLMGFVMSESFGPRVIGL